MKQFLMDHPQIVKWIWIAVTTLIGSSGAGGMAWHHHKYSYGHDRPAVEQSQKYKMSDDETRLKIHEDYLKEKESR